MTLRETVTLARAGGQYVRAELGGGIEFPQDRLGQVLELADGSRFEVYRETALRPAESGDGADGVVVVFRLDVHDPAAGAGLRALLAEPAANVATPLFAGLPGFRRKLWLAGEDPGEFLELYEWATEADADRFVRVMRGLLAPFGFAAAADFAVVEADSVEEFVADRSRGWRGPAGHRRTRRPWVIGVAIGVLALAVALALARRRRGG